MSKKHICPKCSGKGGYNRDPNPYWLTDLEFAKPLEWIKCLTCKGEGSLNSVQYSLYKAGYQPSTQII